MIKSFCCKTLKLPFYYYDIYANIAPNNISLVQNYNLTTKLLFRGRLFQEMTCFMKQVGLDPLGHGTDLYQNTTHTMKQVGFTVNQAGGSDLYQELRIISLRVRGI